eukprot:COSAG06_NODE_17251_length_952_cov_16.480657_2_plen_191_part_00
MSTHPSLAVPHRPFKWLQLLLVALCCPVYHILTKLYRTDRLNGYCCHPALYYHIILTALNCIEPHHRREVVAPRLRATKTKWEALAVSDASDDELLGGMRDMAMEEGYYWSCNSSRTFGVGKSTDDHLQCFLSETPGLGGRNYISGQFLSGIVDPDGVESKTMAANADLFEIARMIREDDELSYDVITTP